MDPRSLSSKWRNKGQTSFASHSAINPGPENTSYDKARHEQMRLRSPNYGNYFLTQGSRPPKEVCSICDRLKVWCDCA